VAREGRGQRRRPAAEGAAKVPRGHRSATRAVNGDGQRDALEFDAEGDRTRWRAPAAPAPRSDATRVPGHVRCPIAAVSLQMMHRTAAAPGRKPPLVCAPGTTRRSEFTRSVPFRCCRLFVGPDSNRTSDPLEGRGGCPTPIHVAPVLQKEHTMLAASPGYKLRPTTDAPLSAFIPLLSRSTTEAAAARTGGLTRYHHLGPPAAGGMGTRRVSCGWFPFRQAFGSPCGASSVARRRLPLA